MKHLAKLGLGLVLALCVVSVAAGGGEAETVTLEGKILCAKCSLEKADAKACQNVLVVAEGEAQGEYYIAKNAVADEFGNVCMAKKPVKVTGSVAEKDGKKWITASAIEELDS